MSARRLSAAFWSSIFALLYCTPAGAQSEKHALTVRVADPAGAPVPGARVTVSARDAPIVIARETAEASKAVTAIDRGEIGARHELAVADALRTVPGATVQQLGGPGSFASIKLRGLREQDTSLLIDGVRFRDAAPPQGDATAFVGELSIVNLDRIEVLRGAGSSLYGSHAVGGAVLPFAVAGIGILLAISRDLDLLVVGEESAATRGVSVAAVKPLIFAAASLMVGGVVATCGPIGFVGLVVPHIGRIVVGPRHRALGPFSVLAGGTFLVACDIGGPFFLAMLVHGHARQRLGGRT